MKKYLCLFFCTFLCLVSSCSQYNDTVNSNLGEKEIIDSGKYYRVYKSNITQVCYEIYDTNGKIASSEETDRPLRINMLNDNIIDIEIGIGTGSTIHKYYDVEKNLFSKDFSYVLTAQNELVAYIDVPKEKPFENRKVIVQNIFDKNLFCKEFQLDFSQIDTPVIETVFSEDGTSLQLIYFTGEEQAQISVRLNLTQ